MVPETLEFVDIDWSLLLCIFDKFFVAAWVVLTITVASSWKVPVQEEIVFRSQKLCNCSVARWNYTASKRPQVNLGTVGGIESVMALTLMLLK